MTDLTGPRTSPQPQGGGDDAPSRSGDGSDAGDRDFARLVFGRVITLASAEGGGPLTEALGLSGAELRALIARHLPDRAALARTLPPDADRGADAIEEPDYRAYLLECRAGVAEDEEAWLAAIIARRSLKANHLWQDMGFASRDELSATLRRYFPELVRRNASDMKWKKFIYRQLCERDGVLVCKSPNCEICTDFAVCFGREDGEPLATLAHLARPGPPGR